MDRFEQWKQRRVVIDPQVMGGEPTFARTRLTVRHIGAMLLRHGDVVLPEIREDYPYLEPEDLEFAKQYTAELP